MTIGIHAGQQYLPCAQFHRPFAPTHGVNSSRGAPAVGIHLPKGIRRKGQASQPGQRLSRRFRTIRGYSFGRYPFGVQGNHNALVTELSCSLLDQRVVVHGGGIDRHFVGSGVQHAAHVLNAADAPSYGQGDENPLRYPLHHVDHGIPGIGAGGDVQEHQLVAAFPVINGGQLRRVSGIP